MEPSLVIVVIPLECHLAFLPSVFPATPVNLKNITPEMCVLKVSVLSPRELLFLFSPEWGVGPEDMQACETELPSEVASKAL